MSPQSGSVHGVSLLPVTWWKLARVSLGVIISQMPYPHVSIVEVKLQRKILEGHSHTMAVT